MSPTITTSQRMRRLLVVALTLHPLCALAMDCKENLPTNTTIPPDIEHPYTQRGDRCEGTYAPGTSQALDARISLIGVVPELTETIPQTKNLLLQWACGEAHVRAVATHELAYRMDTQTTPPFNWTTELLAKSDIPIHQIAVIAIATQNGTKIFCPVRITKTQSSATPPDPIRLRFHSEEPLREIRATLLIDKSTTLTLESTNQTTITKAFFVKIPRGQIPIGKHATLRIRALIPDGHEGTPTSEDFHLGPDM
ncbi:hypothetical protein MFU01_74960 [Myxococcus fulvus]|nr:hypothetical protein MFU01_74960 [Myxococcus fulvus]